VTNPRAIFQSFNEWTFRSQMILLLSITVSVLSLAGAFFNAWHSGKLLYDKEFNFSVAKARHLASETTYLLIYGLDDSVVDVIDDTINYTSIEYVSLFNVQGENVLAHGTQRYDRFSDHQGCMNEPMEKLATTPVLDCRTDNEWVFKVGLFSPGVDEESPFEVDVVHDTGLVGYAFVVVDYSWLTDIRNDIFVKNMLWVISVLGLVLLLVFWFVGRLVQPLGDLSQLMNAAEEGDLGVRANSSGSREVRQMGRAFNGMLSVLELHSATLNWQRKQLAAEIVEKNEKEKALIESEARYRAVIDNASEGIVTIDTSGKIEAVNNAATEIFGYDIDELIGEDVTMLMPEGNRDVHPTFLEKYRDERGSRSMRKQALEVEGRHKDGRTVALEISLGDIEVGGKTHFTGIVRDVTERTQARLELEAYRDHLQDMVDERTRDLVVARDDALAGERAMSTFLANMSHELRTPLHGILSFSRFGIMKLNKVPLEKLLQYFTEINDSGNRLLVLLSNLLDLSKLKAGKVVYDFSEHNVGDIIDAVVREYAALKKEKEVDISVNLSNPDLRINCDGDKISQVIRNLLSNALKFSPAGSSISIVCKKQDNGDVLVRVADQGLGVPEDEIDSIFDAFTQSSKTRNKAGGTGLGLAICKGIVEVGHRGQISVENNPEGGASFNFTIAADLAPYEHELQAKV